MPRPIKRRDATILPCGFLFVTLGVLGYQLAQDYAHGSWMRPGPGDFPRIVSLALIVLGGVMILAGSRHRNVMDYFRHFRLSKSMLTPLFIGAAVATFALTISPLGFVIASFLLVAFTSLATGVRHWRQTLISGLGLTVLCVALFNYALDMHLPLWPR